MSGKRIVNKSQLTRRVLSLTYRSKADDMSGRTTASHDCQSWTQEMSGWLCIFLHLQPVTTIMLLAARSTSSFKRRLPGSIYPIVARKLNTLRRSYLYVPSSSERMLEKSLTTKSDVIIYDLEDSVPPDPLDKSRARSKLKDFLSVRNLCTTIDSECLL